MGRGGGLQSEGPRAYDGGMERAEVEQMIAAAVAAERKRIAEDLREHGARERRNYYSNPSPEELCEQIADVIDPGPR